MVTLSTIFPEPGSGLSSGNKIPHALPALEFSALLFWGGDLYFGKKSFLNTCQSKNYGEGNFNHRRFNHCSGMLEKNFTIAVKSVVKQQPSEVSFDNSAFELKLASIGRITSCYDSTSHPAVSSQRNNSLNQPSRVSTVETAIFWPFEAFNKNSSQTFECSVWIRHGCFGSGYSLRESEGVYWHMSVSSSHLHARNVATYSVQHTPAIADCRGPVFFTLLMQCNISIGIMNPFSDVDLRQQSEVMTICFPPGKMIGNHLPREANAPYARDHIENLPLRMTAMPATTNHVGFGNECLYNLSFQIRQTASTTRHTGVYTDAKNAQTNKFLKTF